MHLLINSRFELLPSDLFEDRLPQAFTTDHIHWYDTVKNEVLFRSRKTPWVSGVKDWRLVHDRIDRSWRLVQESNTLINMTSPSARAFSKIFHPLDDTKHVHVVLNYETKVIDIELPRLQLVFFANLNSTTIHSRQYRGMIIDANQTIGTLVGLSSMLTLKEEISGHERMVLIPVPREFGSQSIRYQKSNLHHVIVNINKDDVSRVYAYSLDNDLKRVLSSGDIQSQLFLCYLFALTSHCLLDPMTMRTGTESALTILQSAAVRSFDLITEKTVELLTQIGGLSPGRSFYPSHERVMQQITWDSNLPPLSQHPGFREGVEDILEHAKKMQAFYPEASVYDLIKESQHELSSGTSRHFRCIFLKRNSFYLNLNANNC